MSLIPPPRMIGVLVAALGSSACSSTVFQSDRIEGRSHSGVPSHVALSTAEKPSKLLLYATCLPPDSGQASIDVKLDIRDHVAGSNTSATVHGAPQAVKHPVAKDGVTAVLPVQEPAACSPKGCDVVVTCDWRDGGANTAVGDWVLEARGWYSIGLLEDRPTLSLQGTTESLSAPP